MTKISLDAAPICDCECPYCEREDEYKQQYGPSRPGIMNIDDIKGIVSYMRKFTSDNAKYSPLEYVEFTGGEPLIDEDTTNKVIETAKYCKEVHNLRTAVYTNGNALRSNPGKIDTLYEHLDAIIIGVHDYSKYGLDSLFDIVKHKAESKGSNNKLLINFIVNEETKEQLSQIKKKIDEIGIGNTAESNIYFNFYDMIPLGRSDDMIPLILPKESIVMDELDEHYKDIFSELKCDKNIKVKTKKDGVAVPSTCNLKDDTFVIDAYGNLRFCPIVYGPVFGSMKDVEIEDALAEREKWYGIFNLYDKYGAPAELAREIGNVNPDECYRGYCCFTLSRLFREYKTADMLVEDIEGKIMPEKNPLEEPPEEYSEYDLTLFQKRALQEVLSEEPSAVLDKTGMIYKQSEILPEELRNEVRIGALRDVVDNRPEEVTEELLRGVRYFLDDANSPKLNKLKKDIGTILRKSANKRAEAAMTHEWPE